MPPPAGKWGERASPFHRGLGLFDATNLVIGCIIGAGIFRLPALVASSVHSPAAFLLTWLIGGLVSLTGALAYVELSRRFPRTGGDYVFIREGYGRPLAFLFGWTKVFVERVGTIAILAYVFSEHFTFFLGIPKGKEKEIAAFAILVLTLVNVLGLGFGKWVQNVTTLLKVASLMFIAGAGLLARGGSRAHFLSGGEFSFRMMLDPGIGLGLIFVLWTYGGWTEAVYVAEEVKEPEKNIPRSVLSGLLITTLLYLLINVIYLAYLPLEELRRTPLVAASVLEKIGGSWGGKILALFVFISTVGALNGYILTGGRILFALARDHVLFRHLSRVYPATQTPFFSLVFNGVFAIVLVMTRTFDSLVTYTTVVITLFFILACAGLIVFDLRAKRNSEDRGHRYLGKGWAPLIFISVMTFFLANAVWREPREALFGFALTLLGFPLYFLSERMRSIK